MKVLSYPELEQVVEALKGFVGSELQSFSQSKNEFVLKHWDGEGLLTLIGDLSPARPLVLPFTEKPPVSFKPEKKPLSLFFSANIKGAVLKDIRVSPEWGRVIWLDYELDGSKISIEVRCLPHAANLIVKTPEKQMSWSRPKDLEKREPQDLSHLQVRPLEQLIEEWLVARKGGGSKIKMALDSLTGKQKQAALKEKHIAKSEKLLKKLKTQLTDKGQNPWDQKIEFLVASQESGDQTHLIDVELSFSKNLQLAYEKQAKWVDKYESLEARVAELESELKQMQQQDWKPEVSQKKITDKVDDSTKWKTRHFSDGVIGYIGKSARDNLKILRRARSWDYWLHIKDQPGSFGIVQRNKNQKVSETVLQEMALWVAEQSFGGKTDLKKGLVSEVLVAECRYVRPIKGDKMGRVNYSNARTLSVK